MAIWKHYMGKGPGKGYILGLEKQHEVAGNDMDWYGILQVEVTSDEASIKKQYRKLALLPHPNKNSLHGADTAFKLIGEAHRVLTDRAKRSLFDMKYKAFKGRSQLPQQRPCPVRKQHVVGNSYGNRGRTQYAKVNLQLQLPQPTQPTKEQLTFWIACPFCTMRYQYYNDLLNRALRCQNCFKPFIAYNLNVQGVPRGVPSGAPCTQPAAPQ
ncbi:hypothetical protein IFM89_019523 [Coptis chinensis]|uniref:J domain-containing protein n=1 Tax=Coptis chinensis TaxID=261450 RepID=A0A835LYR5_9MAGN|nr:hypothetical protein IFM89_019523 [Coptis chinensis]